MKKAIKLLMMAIALISAAAFTACSDDDNENTTLSKFTIDPTAATLTASGEVSGRWEAYTTDTVTGQLKVPQRVLGLLF